MTILQAIILAVLEGLTEFLPISSTGHLLLAQELLNIPSSDFTKTFTIIIQLAAILAVVVLFRENIFHSIKLWKQTLLAFLPTGVIGLISYAFIRDVLFENPIIITYSLFVGGVILLMVDRLPKISEGKREIADLNMRQLFNIGIYQSFSIIPGVSRSAASIIGGLASGLSHFSAVEFSFFLAIPTMLAATGFDLYQSGLKFSPQEYLIIAIGCLVSFLSALVAINAFVKFVKKNNFTIFAIYRIILAGVFWFILKS